MSRIVEINQAADNALNSNFIIEDNKNSFIQGFNLGAIWADKNPKSKYDLSDPDLIRSILESIEDEAQRTTTGNVAHNTRSIMLLARNALKYIKKNE